MLWYQRWQLDDFRVRLEQLWEIYEPFADKNFYSEIKRQFGPRAWELYIGATFVKRGNTLNKHIDSGPDISLSMNSNNVLVEAIAINKGTSPDKVPEVEFGKLMDVPEEEMMLRITTGFSKKYKKHLVDIDKGVVSRNDSFVIAINRAGTDFLDAQIPLILKCLFGIGYQTLTIGKSVKAVKDESNWTQRNSITKANGEIIPMTYFNDPEYGLVSAVIYCTKDIINGPIDQKDLGDDCVIVFNPFAKNPIPFDFLKFGEKWTKVGNQVKKV
jgi:hypothetical protein